MNKTLDAIALGLPEPLPLDQVDLNCSEKMWTNGLANGVAGRSGQNPSKPEPNGIRPCLGTGTTNGKASFARISLPSVASGPAMGKYSLY